MVAVLPQAIDDGGWEMAAQRFQIVGRTGESLLVHAPERPAPGADRAGIDRPRRMQAPELRQVGCVAQAQAVGRVQPAGEGKLLGPVIKLHLLGRVGAMRCKLLDPRVRAEDRPHHVREVGRKVSIVPTKS